MLCYNVIYKDNIILFTPRGYLSVSVRIYSATSNLIYKYVIFFLIGLSGGRTF